MATQSGLKHAATEPSHLDDKRSLRRRGAAGRAAVLRRAPSDSDCSAETASLSADSNERLRPAPPPRANKTRSRRRGSEWEVLEGLKDGQRFERRPEVFNGYLHKKRKWPLKGWHKRFFVVDGGILVYARSPADVARGRLHGSVDVGLSVISAKARRRRIDIDADEFIYHLRAKTPDVFRTWLNVLKAHRLYRQHLLTFGARESVPKIHAPLEDLPPTENSSPSSSSFLPSSTDTSKELLNCLKEPDNMSTVYSQKILCYNNIKNDKPMYKWSCAVKEECNELMPLNFEPLEDVFDIKQDIFTHSLCSMKCMAKIYEKDYAEMKKSPHESVAISETEKQMDCTELDVTSLRTNDPDVDSVDFNYSLKLNHNVNKDKSIEPVLPPFSDATDVTDALKSSEDEKSSLFMDRNAEPTTALFLFARKKKACKRQNTSECYAMKKSKKSTNLVKYRNHMEEPTLKRPLSKNMLLKKHRTKASKSIGHEVVEVKVNNEIQVEEKKEDKSQQDSMTISEYDDITEKLITNIFNKKFGSGVKNTYDVQYYVNHMVRELYDVKLNQAETHPVKVLFRSLLEYWLKNTDASDIKNAVKRVKSVEVQSNIYFTRDQKLSSLVVNKATEETQYYGFEQGKDFEPKVIEKKRVVNRPTYSFVKERRIQELERLLKSTVYTCETLCSRSKEKDIAITKKLINNLDSSPRSSGGKYTSDGKENSNSSTEFPEIQETFNHFISETAIPADVAKEFLGAYLDMLLYDNSSNNNSSPSTEETKDSMEIPVCEVQTESVQKRMSVGVVTTKVNDTEVTKNETVNDQDSGQKYLRDILDKITAIFSKLNKGSGNKCSVDKDVQPDDTKAEGSQREVRSEYPGKKLISENNDENSIVLDLTKYDLEHISMFSDPAIKGVMSITIKLKERTFDVSELKPKNLNLKFSENTTNCVNKSDWYMSNDSSAKHCVKRNMEPILSFKNPYIDYDPNAGQGRIELKPYLSSSDATSKAFKIMYESEHSLDFSVRNNTPLDNLAESKKSFDYHDDLQSCYILSTVKKSTMSSAFQLKKKVRVKDCNGIVLGPNEQTSKSPNIIDENFILLLLENLTMLSTNIPGIHKEINCLYTKLKKKHEKEIKNCATSGLGLLGKIYNETKVTNDTETQFEMLEYFEKPVRIKSSNIEIGMNTSKNVFGLNLVDRATSINVCVSELRDFGVQTEEQTCRKERKSVNFVEENTSTSAKEIKETGCHCIEYKPNTVNISTECTNSDWFDAICTRDCTIGTAIRGILDDKGSCQNFRFVPDRQSRGRNVANIRFIENSKTNNVAHARVKLDKKLWGGIKQASLQEGTQTERRTILRDRKIKKDFNVYQLFVSNKFHPTMSSSMSSSNLEVQNSDFSDMRTIYRCNSDPSYSSESGGPLENASRELGQAQLSVQQLQRLLDALELQQHHHDTDVFDKVSLEGASPSVKKDRRKFGLRKKKTNKCASVELAPHPPHLHDGSASHMALSALTAPPSPGGGASSMPNSAASLPIACAAARPQSLPGPGTEALGAGPASLSSLTPDHQLREDFTVLAKDLVTTLKGVVATLVCERGRLRAAVEATEGGTGGGVTALRNNLNAALHMNSELRARLTRIHDASDLADLSNNTDPVNRPFQQSLSYSSSCVSASEFFDAEEHEEQPQDILPADEAGVIELDGDSSSEAGSLSSEDGSASSDNSDGALLSAESVTVRLNNGVEPSSGWVRRTRLPCPRPQPGGPSLWNLLYKNIGKDLSQVSMPVTINEPLNMLQRLCEELEYSELLDSASSSGNPIERMSLIAAFAVSAYAASAHRAASKPFNPLLGETYECVRQDRGFKFLAEQVSHHPPISACHAESTRWCLWQEARIKTKFWGKSMEFQPAGRVHVRLLPNGDHYSWNKVTTCVHNLFGGQRWVDQYGDMTIMCHGTEITAKLNFIKASSWSSSRHEVRGFVSDGATNTRVRLQGRWSEALYAGEPPSAKCLWRPGAMPPDHELYYGFTRFAMELNEMEPGLRELLPCTDTRLRPDQRALEEGDVESAEQFKHDLEQQQRDRRRHSPEHTPCWFRKAIEESEEMWVFSGSYWRSRDAHFPPPPALPRLW